jgi:hypothetical protein
MYSTPAIIMNIFPDGEESVIAECLTHDLGRIYVHNRRKQKYMHTMFVGDFFWWVGYC